MSVPENIDCTPPSSLVSTFPRIAAKLRELHAVLKGEFDRWSGTRNKTIVRIASFMTDLDLLIDVVEGNDDIGIFLLAFQAELGTLRLEQCFLERKPHAERTRAARSRALALMNDFRALALEDPGLNP